MATEVDTEALLRRVIEVIGNAKSMPLSNSVLISKDEVLEMLEDAATRLPDELRQARWMLKERDDFLAKVKREGDDILEAARVRAERMVQRTEIVREAQHTATRTIEVSRDEANRMRNECEDYCDQKLASFEIVLERTLTMIRAGRDKLAAPSLPATSALADGPDEVAEEDEEFFDQDID